MIDITHDKIEEFFVQPRRLDDPSQQRRKTHTSFNLDMSRKIWQDILSYKSIFSCRNAVLAVLVITVVVIHASLVAHIGNRSPLGDGIMYADLSKLNIFHKNFWFNPRAPFYPVLLQVFGSKIYVFQKFLYLFSSVILMYQIFRKSPNVVGSVAILLVALIVSCQNYAMWDSFVMTESYTFSGCILLMVFGVMLTRHAWVIWSGIFIILSTIILTRDVMLYFGMSFLLLLSIEKVWHRVKWRRPRPQVVSGTDGWRRGLVMLSLAVFVASSVATWCLQRIGGRYLPNLVNVVQMRLLPDAEARSFLAEHGLTIGQVLASRAYKAAWDDQADYPAPDMAAFGNWVKASGLKTYEAFLVTHPARTFSYLIDDRPNPRVKNLPPILSDIGIPALLNLHFSGFYPIADIAPTRGALPWITSLPITFIGYTIVFLVACISYVMSLRSRRTDPIACFVISSLAGLIVTELADPWDIWRHGLPFILIAQLSIPVFIIRLGRHASPPGGVLEAAG